MKEENYGCDRKIIDHIQGGIFVGLDKDLVQEVGSCVRFCVTRFVMIMIITRKKVVDNYLQNGDCIILTGVGIR